MIKYFRIFFITILTIFAQVPTANIAAAQEQTSAENPASVYEEARAVLFDDPEKAISLLAASKGAQGVIPVEWELFHAYAIYETKEHKSPDARRMKLALEAYENSGAAPTYEYGRILSTYARWQVSRRDPEDAQETALRAEEILLATRPDDVEAIAQTIIWRGIGFLFERPQFNSLIRNAFEEFSRARALFPEGKQAGEYPVVFWETIAWQAAAAGAMASRENPTDDMEGLDAAFSVSTAPACAVQWNGKRDGNVRLSLTWEPNLMTRGAASGYVVAVDVEEDGTPVNIRLIGEAIVPQNDKRKDYLLKRRDKAIVKAVDRWSAVPETVIPTECSRDRILIFGGYARPDGDPYNDPTRIIRDLPGAQIQ